LHNNCWNIKELPSLKFKHAHSRVLQNILISFFFFFIPLRNFLLETKLNGQSVSVLQNVHSGLVYLKEESYTYCGKIAKV